MWNLREKEDLKVTRKTIRNLEGKGGKDKGDSKE
jgi:hypothetical protein